MRKGMLGIGKGYASQVTKTTVLKDATGAEWRLPLTRPPNELYKAKDNLLRRTLNHHMEKRAWSSASEHYFGTGLEQGVSMWATKRNLKKIAKNELPTDSSSPSHGAYEVSCMLKSDCLRRNNYNVF